MAVGKFGRVTVTNNPKVPEKKTRSMATASTPTQMVVPIKASGPTANNMAKAYSLLHKATNVKASGTKVSALNGWMIRTMSRHLSLPTPKPCES